MKRNVISFLTLLLASIVSTVHAESTLTASQIKSSVDAGYEVSDNYTTLTECTTKKDAFNLQYTSYKRSDCFRDSVGYKYFICGLGESCTVTAVVATASTSSSSSNNTTSSSSTTTSTSSAGTQVSNQDKLDAFLAKVRGMKTELNDDDKYERILTSVISKLQVLKTKYASNTTVSSMVVYLSNGVTSIKDALVKNKDVDNFFCELAGGCSPSVVSTGTTSTGSMACPVYSVPAPPVGCNYTFTQDNSGCEKPGKLACESASGSVMSLSTEEIAPSQPGFMYIDITAGANVTCGTATKDSYSIFDSSALGNRKAEVSIANCKEMGGYIRTMCPGKPTDIRSIDTVKNNDRFSCQKLDTSYCEEVQITASYFLPKTKSDPSYHFWAYNPGANVMGQEFVCNNGKFQKFGPQKWFDSSVISYCEPEVIDGYSVPRITSNGQSHAFVYKVVGGKQMGQEFRCVDKKFEKVGTQGQAEIINCKAISIDGYTLPSTPFQKTILGKKEVGNKTYHQDFHCVSGKFKKLGDEDSWDLCMPGTVNGYIINKKKEPNLQDGELVTKVIGDKTYQAMARCGGSPTAWSIDEEKVIDKTQGVSTASTPEFVGMSPQNSYALVSGPTFGKLSFGGYTNNKDIQITISQLNNEPISCTDDPNYTLSGATKNGITTPGAKSAFAKTCTFPHAMNLVRTKVEIAPCLGNACGKKGSIMINENKSILTLSGIMVSTLGQDIPATSGKPLTVVASGLEGNAKACQIVSVSNDLLLDTDTISVGWDTSGLKGKILTPFGWMGGSMTINPVKDTTVYLLCKFPTMDTFSLIKSANIKITP